MTTYQRLKAENKELIRQLIILTSEPESTSANLIKMQWRLRIDMEKQLWKGNMLNTGQTAQESDTTNA